VSVSRKNKDADKMEKIDSTLKRKKKKKRRIIILISL